MFKVNLEKYRIGFIVLLDMITNWSLLFFFDRREKVRYPLVFTTEILYICKNVAIKKDLWHELQNPLCKVIVMAFILSKFYCSLFCVLKSFQFLSRKFMYYEITQKAFSHKKTSFPKTYSFTTSFRKGKTYLLLLATWDYHISNALNR